MLLSSVAILTPKLELHGKRYQNHGRLDGRLDCVHMVQEEATFLRQIAETRNLGGGGGTNGGVMRFLEAKRWKANCLYVC